MPCTATIRLTLPPTAAQMLARITDEAVGRDPKLVLSRLEELLRMVRSGAHYGAAGPVTGEWSALEVQVPSAVAVRASQTFTYSKLATAGKVLTINGISVTAKAAGPLGVDEFLQGNEQVEAANNAAACINASPTAGLTGVAFATAAGQGAWATAKCATVVAGNSLTVGGVLFTATAVITDYVYVNDAHAHVPVGASDAAQAAIFAYAINTHPVTRTRLVATSDGIDTVTIRAIAVDTSGNAIDISKVGVPITLAPAATTTLVGGCAPVGQGRAAIGAAGVVTVYATQPGAYQNAITTVTDDAGACVAGGATMASGAGEDALPYFWRI